MAKGHETGRRTRLRVHMNPQATHPQRAAAGYLARTQRRLAVEAVKILFRRRLDVRIALPLISFTFDDFPRSAFGLP
jgi:hypothetical protein